MAKKKHIVDFVSFSKRELYEIKPDSTRKSPVDKAKFEVAEKWCKENNFVFIVVGNRWFEDNINLDLFTENEHLIKPMCQFL